MNLYLITQDVNNDWDTYDAAVVAAETSEDAITIHPTGNPYTPEEWDQDFINWAQRPDQVTAKFIGVASEGTLRGVVLASFNAG